jgi:hypothetical protein
VRQGLRLEAAAPFVHGEQDLRKGQFIPDGGTFCDLTIHQSARFWLTPTKSGIYRHGRQGA